MIGMGMMWLMAGQSTLFLLGIAHGVGYGGMDDRVFMFLQSISYINNYKKQL